MGEELRQKQKKAFYEKTSQHSSFGQENFSKIYLKITEGYSPAALDSNEHLRRRGLGEGDQEGRKAIKGVERGEGGSGRFLCSWDTNAVWKKDLKTAEKGTG